MLGEVTVVPPSRCSRTAAPSRSTAPAGRDGRIGLAPNLVAALPGERRPADARGAASASDGYVNRWFLDAVFRGATRTTCGARYEALLGPLDFVRDGDLAHDRGSRPTSSASTTTRRA